MASSCATQACVTQKNTKPCCKFWHDKKLETALFKLQHIYSNELFNTLDITN